LNESQRIRFFDPLGGDCFSIRGAATGLACGLLFFKSRLSDLKRYLQGKPMAKLEDVKNTKTRSLWDDNVDGEKVKKLSKEDKHKLFPNDYAADGSPYGDY
jgi:hypothetical protein